VIGVNVAVAQSGQNIGFAIPINVVKDSLKNFNETGQFDRPFLGVRYTMITRDMSLQSRLPEGAYIREVVKGSPAASAGLQAGDIVIKINGKDIKDKDGGLATVINKLKIGQKVPVEFDRDGEVKTVEITLQAMEE
jgi:serine protease Do